MFTVLHHQRNISLENRIKMTHSGDDEFPKRDDDGSIITDDLSILSLQTTSTQIKTVIVRTVLALIFLGLGIGAVVYSVTNSEGSQKKVNKTEIPLIFYPFISQTCNDGNLTIVLNRNESDDSEWISREVKTIEASWIQDNQNERLYHRIGPTNDEWHYTIYAHKTFLVNSSRQGCMRSSEMNYRKYIESIGLLHLRRSGKQIMERMDDLPVIVYRDEPPTNLTISGVHPKLVSAYLCIETGLMLGYEQFFGRSDDNFPYSIEFLCPSMKTGVANPDVFFDFPDKCETISEGTAAVLALFAT